MKRFELRVFILTGAIIVLLTGCGTIQNKVAEKVSEGVAEKSIGGKVDITKDGIKVQKDGASFQSGNNLKWPEAKMGDLPEPKAKITAVMDGNESCTIVFSEMSQEEANAYLEKVKALGYKDGMSFSDTDSITYTGQNSDKASVMFSYKGTSKEGSIVYTSAKAKQ